jgi:hypothetical protein
MAKRHAAVHLFDLPFLSSLYRVFLLPGSLQVDLSFTPAADSARSDRSSSCCSAARSSVCSRRRRQRATT